MRYYYEINMVGNIVLSSQEQRLLSTLRGRRAVTRPGSLGLDCSPVGNFEDGHFCFRNV